MNNELSEKPNIKYNKKIILLSDGTGNSRARIWRSNVWRLYRALDLEDGSRQVAFYDDGVGTSSTKIIAALGGIFGFGLSRNVRDLYSFLCRTYEPGDEIYLFGFSRGAFTVRVLAGLICKEGIIKDAHDERILKKSVYSTYKKFRRAAFGQSLLKGILEKIADLRDWVFQNERPSQKYEAGIHFMGIWDTVDAYGGPIDELTDAYSRVVWPLKAADQNISSNIKRVCHALALDEQRQSFQPMLINENQQETEDNVSRERITQVWFNGVHSDIGGGYPDNGLSLVTLKWMLEQCKSEFELKILPLELENIAKGADHTSRLNDSRSGLGVFYRYSPRNLETLCRAKIGKQDSVCVELPKIHYTVFDRIMQRSSAKVPFNVPAEYAIVDQAGDIIPIPISASDGWQWEHSSEAQNRYERQLVLWNKVWAGKILYYVIAALITGFLSIPFLWPSDRLTNLEERVIAKFGSWGEMLSKFPELVQKLISVVPGSSLLNPIFDFYILSPALFLIGFVSIIFLLWFSGTLNTALYDKMGTAWGRVRSSGLTSGGPSANWQKKVSSLLLSPTYAKLERGLKKAVDALFTIGLLILVAYLVLIVASRFVLFGLDTLGGVCEPTKGELREIPGNQPVVIKFSPENPCTAIGWKVGAGKIYEIALKTKVATPEEHKYLLKSVSDGKSEDWKHQKIAENKFWSDHGIISDLTGWKENRWYMPAFVPLRRHLFFDWYLPVIRIGHRGFFRSSTQVADNQLNNIHEVAKISQSNKQDQSNPITFNQELKFTFEAQREGELFLYLNDAILFHPDVVKFFYANNNGYATITITQTNK